MWLVDLLIDMYVRLFSFCVFVFLVFREDVLSSMLHMGVLT